MKIPPDAIIADEKLTDYLLVAKARNDKSKFLAGAGFNQENSEALKAAIRSLTNESDAVEEKRPSMGFHIKLTAYYAGQKSANLL